MTGRTDIEEIRSAYKDLLRLCSNVMKREDMPLLREAFEIALRTPSGQWEEHRNKYLFHSIEVARVSITQIGLGFISVLSALLHHAFVSRELPVDVVKKKFGQQVADILRGFEKVGSLETGKISYDSENFRNLYLSIISDVRVILIMLAHRLVDLWNYDLLSMEKQERFLREVEHLYIPIAHRLGLYNVKSEMEEYWMKYTNPGIYQDIARQIMQTDAKRSIFIKEFIRPIERAMMAQGMEYDIIGRPKSIHSIWRKMKRQGVPFEEVYDLFAVRIIIASEGKNEKADCWKVYSIVTDLYKPNPDRLRDWISTPKASGYESLHTTVVGPNGKWVEVQIRTSRMDEIAEKGLAAHWKYKEGSMAREEWMKKIREQLEKPESERFDNKDASRIEVTPGYIYALTPEGDLKKLPVGATVLDFAYEIHSSLGSMCTGAKISNKMVPIRHVLKNGDKVEILASKNQKPNLDWLNWAITTKARTRIRRALKEEDYREANVGKEMLIRKLRNLKTPFTDQVIDRLVKAYKLKSSIDLYHLIAIEKIELVDIRKKLKEATAEEKPAEEAAGKAPKAKPAPGIATMIIDDIGNLNYKLARCCHPVSGVPVFGFITVGKGITIHRRDCPNAKRLISNYAYRIIDVKWRTSASPTYLATISVSGDDELGILNTITETISRGLKVNVVSVNVGTTGKGRFEGTFKVSVSDPEHVSQLLHRLMKVKGVRKARRIGNLEETDEGSLPQNNP
jgi:GTP pyrophosphokinase